MNLGYRVVIATDAVAGVPAEYAKAVLDNSLRYLATLRTVDEIAAGLAMILAGRAGGDRRRRARRRVASWRRRSPRRAPTSHCWLAAPS